MQQDRDPESNANSDQQQLAVQGGATEELVERQEVDDQVESGHEEDGMHFIGEPAQKETGTDEHCEKYGLVS
jgi:hypothetical protein